MITAVEEIMMIQQRKAEDNQINFHATFENIGSDNAEREVKMEFLEDAHSYMVVTDQ